MGSIALGRNNQMLLTNKSGGSVAQGDVVVLDPANAASFTTTTTSGYTGGVIGVVIEPNGIANNAIGMIAFAGPVPKINLSASASLGDLFKTHSVAKQAVRHAAGLVLGDFGAVLGTGTSPAAVLWGLPAGLGGAGSGDVVGPSSAVDANLAGFNGTGGKTIQDSGLGLNGWIVAGETWTYAAADSPSFTFTITGDKSGKYQAGQRVKLTQSTGGTKYFIITKVAVSTDTTITVYGGTDYTLNNETISSPYYSIAKAPFGFPLDPAKWTVTVTDVTERSQATPSASTWYNLGSLSISIPIGVWNVSYQVTLFFVDSTAGDWTQLVTLSTANNSESDADLSAEHYGSSIKQLMTTMHRAKTIALTSKTTHYLNSETTTAGLDSIRFKNDGAKMIIRAVCAYL